MMITAIEPTKKGRFSIFLEGEFYCSLHGDILASSQLKCGQSIEICEVEDLYRESQLKITKDRALRLLSQRSYCSGGLYRKLVEYSDEEAAQAAVERMEELGLLDDEDYARRFASDCISLKGYSRKRTFQAMLEKGIDRDTAENALEMLDADDSHAVGELLRKKYYARIAKGDPRERDRVIAALTRRGFAYGEIRRALELLEEELPEG